MFQSQILPYPEVKSILKPSRLVVFLHGYGSDGNDLIELAQIMQASLPDGYFISPHGIQECEAFSSARQWFSLSDRSVDSISPLIQSSSNVLSEIIVAKQKELGLSNEQTVLIGFSQGTMMALYLNLSSEKPFQSVVGFSGRLIPPPKILNFQTPVCLIHGEHDDVIPINELHVISEYFKKNSIKHKAHTRTNLRHSIDMEGIEIAINWIIGNV
jgi:phospholipase/carboxylesterase